ncbi:MAG: XRE family transcriptional regulator [Bacteroidales bacterium]|nr:XRE family transcriptional regulator [Bacteroidales bacterium]
MSKKALAERCGLSSAAISNYEYGKRKPENMEIIKRLASALDVTELNFISPWSDSLQIEFHEYRKQSGCSIKSQDYVQSAVEEYLNRFYAIIEILGEKVLPDPPACYSLALTGDIETDAMRLREHLQLARVGSVGKLIEGLENLGIIVFLIDFEAGVKFSGMNGFVNGRPYIVLSRNAPTGAIRSTLAHELVHIMFDWSDFEGDSEKMAMAIGGAFLFPKSDAIRELGVVRHSISKDMLLVCQEYGISFMLLTKRANLCNIIHDHIAKKFYIQANQYGWRYNDPLPIPDEVPTVFEQLVYRAINQNEISLQKGAELLKASLLEVEERCVFKTETAV